MNEFLVTFAFELSKALLPILVSSLVGLVVVWSKKLLADIQASEPDLYTYLTEAVSIGVMAAEKAGATEMINDKKDYAMGIAQRYLNNSGWENYDIEVLEAAIEAEVLRMFG